ncbi:hypothetical protein OQA88_2719 [Cercophora sp. LCS_1]
MDSLPAVEIVPTRYPQSCASISLYLFLLLDRFLPAPPKLALSVGSGPGLLEAMFLAASPGRVTEPVSFYGVEVATSEGQQPVNRYLPEQNTLTVPGTWAVAGDVLDETEGLLFVYPRSPALIKEYLDKGKGVKVAIWIGPNCDIAEMTAPLGSWGVDQKVWQSEEILEGGEAVMVFERE